MNTTHVSNFYIPKEAAKRQPDWELAKQSQKESSIFTEEIPFRIMTVIGTLVPFRYDVPNLGGFTGLEVYLSNYPKNAPSIQQAQSVKFKFEGVNMQNVFSLQLENAILVGVDRAPPVSRRIPTESGNLCGDGVDDQLANQVIFLEGGYNFASNRGRGALKILLRNMHASPLYGSNVEYLMEISIFHAEDTGYYTFEQFFDKVVARLKDNFEKHFGGVGTLAVEFILTSEGFFRLIFKPDATLLAAAGNFSDLEIDINPITSPGVGLIRNWLCPSRLLKGGQTSGTVVDGDGIEFVVKRVEPVNEASNLVTPWVVFISKELTEYQNGDSITPVQASGELGVGILSHLNALVGGIPTAANVNPTAYACSVSDGSLVAGKVRFDDTVIVENFEVEVATAVNNPLLQTMLTAAAPANAAGAPNWELLEKTLTLQLTFKLQ